MKKLLMLILVFFLFLMTIGANANNIRNFEKEVKEILNKVSPSIVKVVAENHRKYIASGIVISKSHILSNISLIRKRYNKIYAITKNEEKIPLKLIGKDYKTGLILFKFNNKNLKPIRREISGSAGDWVVLIGAFYNKIPTIFTGIISNASVDELILNAPIPPAGIGSAVLNRKGHLIGVVKGKLRFSSFPTYEFRGDKSNISIFGKHINNNNLSYAIPIKKVMNITQHLEKFGKVKRGWLGVKIIQSDKGVKISSIINKSPAFNSKLKRNDIVISIEGKKINSPIDLQRKISATLPNTNLKFTILRNNKVKDIFVKIGKRKESKKLNGKYNFNYNFNGKDIFDEISNFPKININNFKIKILGTPKLGIYGKSLTKDDALKFKSNKDYGVLVTELVKNGVAEKSGIKRWDILTKINGKPLKSKRDLINFLKKSKSGDKTNFTVCRNGKDINIKAVLKNNYSINKDILRDSLKNLSVLLSDNFENKIKLNGLQRKLDKLRYDIRHNIKNEKNKIEIELEKLKKSIVKQFNKDYMKLKEKKDKLLKSIEKLEKKMKN